ncbi:MAG: MotA/TolQ/ExbB proton channel family protein [Gammaproteobacteria bacterium]
MSLRSFLFFLIVSFSSASQAAPQTLEDLLNEVRQGRAAEKIDNEERVKRFEDNKNQQASILAKAKADLLKEELRGEQLRLEYEENQQKAEDQEEILLETAGAINELQGVTRQMARDIKSVISASLVSAEKTDRISAIEALANSKELPSSEQLQTLWQTILEEMIESGKVSQFKAGVVTTDGDEIEKMVTRVGTFNASADGQFLRYLPETGRLIEPRRQPSYRFQKLAENLEKHNNEELMPMVIDPTRGAMLALLVQKPNLNERIKQGGVIGYIIIAIGIIALLIAIERFTVLFATGRKVKKQTKINDPDIKNPLGRIMLAYTENPDINAETLELKLDEAILRELPKIKRGLRTLAILAAIAPLLGLLGTVTGIIETFQSITLYGTGDPRLMSGGISQALVTTVLGLVVAIPILLLHSMLSGRSNDIVQILDEKSVAIVARLAEKRSASV